MRTTNQKHVLAPTLACGLGVLGVVTLLTGMVGSLRCWSAEVEAQNKPKGSVGATLRVGITPDYPPLVFRQPDGTNGVEIDLAKALGTELNRPVEFVVLRWDELIPALVDGQTDIIMSGMSVTKARQLRIAFSDPYLTNQLRAIFRQKDAARFRTCENILTTTAKIGVIAGTTADVFVGKNCTNAERVTFTGRRDVPYLLAKGGRMDAYIDDTFALAQMVSENEAEITYLQQPLSEENLAWGVRKSDSEFLSAVNRTLAKWKTDGTLEKTLDHWIPYLKTYMSKQANQPKN